MPVMIARGDGPGHGISAAGEDAGVAGVKHGPVRDDREPERRRRFGGARTAAAGLRSLHSGSGRVFAAVTLMPALLAVAWLVPGTGLLLAGRLLPMPMVIVSGTLAVALCYFAMRRLPARWPRFSGAERGVPAGALLLMMVIAAGFGLWQALFRSSQVFAGSDPGAYLQYGYWIAMHGTARIPESAASFGGAPGLAFAPAGFTVAGSSVTPGFLPGLPLVLAGGAWLGGLSGALLMPAVVGGCALLSFGGLVGRLCGAWQAVAAELVLAVCLPEVYTARTSLAEPLVQVLLFGGLCLFTDSLAVRSRGGGLVLAGLGGLALGLTVLASIASLVVLLPALPVLAVLFAAGRPQALPFGLGLIAGAGAGVAAGLVLARSYLAGLSAQLHLIVVCAAGFGAACALAAVLALPVARPRVRRAFAFNVRFGWFKGEQVVLPSLSGVAQWLALVLPVAVLVVLAERPYFQVIRGQADPSMIRTVASLQRLEQLPVDGLRQYDESSLYWVVWYLGVPAVLLACAGAAVLGRRTVEAVLDGRSAVSLRAARLWVLPLLVIFWSVAAVLWDPSVVPWQPLASHRLAPVVAARARAARGAVVVVADVARLDARRLACGRRPCRRLLRAGPGHPAPRDHAEPRAGRQAVGGTVLVGHLETREPGAAARRGCFGYVRRVVDRGLVVVRFHRAVGERPVRVFVDGGDVRVGRAGVLRAAGRVGRAGAVVAGSVGGGARAGGALDRGGRAAPGTPRTVPFVGLTVRWRAAAGGLAADLRGRRGPDRGPGRYLAGHVLGLAGRAARHRGLVPFRLVHPESARKALFLGHLTTFCDQIRAFGGARVEYRPLLGGSRRSRNFALNDSFHSTDQFRRGRLCGWRTDGARRSPW